MFREAMVHCTFYPDPGGICASELVGLWALGFLLALLTGGINVVVERFL